MTGGATRLAAASFAIALVGVFAYANVDEHGNPYAGYQFAIGVSGVLVGGFVARRRPDHPLGFVILAAGTGSFLTFTGSSVIDWMLRHMPGQDVLGRVVLHSSTWGWIVTRYALTVWAPLVYPTGWPRGWWSRSLAWAGTAAIAVTVAAHSRLFTFEYFAGQPPEGTARLAERVLPWGHRAACVLAFASLLTMAVRVVRLDRAERPRHMPVALALAVLILPILNSLYSEAFGGGFSLADDLELWAMMLLPVVLAVGVLLAGVLDIDVVLRRATTYALLTSVAALVYLAVVWVFSLFLQEGSGAGPLLATGVIAAGVVPLYAWAEGVVARRVFGNRANPYAVVGAVGNRLEHAPPGDRALQTIVDTLGEQLRLPFVAVEVVAGDTVIEAARWGHPGPPVERLALTFQGEHLGELVVAQRTIRDPFRPSELELLQTFARQCGVVVRNASLTEALRRSRMVLLEAREAERRRIRRDLHDGLGPTLATVSLSLGAAAERLHDDPELSALLRDLEAEIRDSIADIRRLVYDLRPPALDDLGLVEAVRGEAARIGSHASDLAIEVEGSSVGDGLPAAVELAAYRVAVEAMTNAARHAQAAWCRVAIDQNHQLVVRVDDDGTGMPVDVTRGVGLRSMQERVVELGGSLRIEPRPTSGTTVTAAFPLEGCQ